MKVSKISIWILFLCLCLNVLIYAQGETAVPFLLITSSSEGNGMGGISASVLSDNAMAMTANPGQLGIQSLDSYFRTSFYTPKTDWIPPFQQKDLTFNTTALSLGVNLNKVTSFPFPLSVGIGYSRIFLNLGTFVVTGSDPTPIATIEGYEKAENISLALGLDYIVKVGIGVNVKNIDSHILLPDSTLPSSSRSAFANAQDFGIMLHVPVTDIISKLRSEPWAIFAHTEPQFNLTFAYVHSNNGSEIQYLPISGSDPLPRKATLGGSFEIGLVSTAALEKWKIVSLTMAREADDILVNRFPTTFDSNGVPTFPQPPFEYQGGTGDIDFFNNVILGEWNGKVFLHKGWQINLGEILYIRGGSVEAPGLRYSTSGFGFRLHGVFNLIEALDKSEISSSVLSFVANHIDLQFDHSSETSEGPRNGTSYNGLSFIIK